MPVPARPGRSGSGGTDGGGDGSVAPMEGVTVQPAGPHGDGADTARLRSLVRDVPDFPRPGIVFRDITPLLADADALRRAVTALASPFADAGIDRVVGIEARGFIFAAPVACALGAGFVPVRKPGKLPWETVSEPYELEYGVDELEAHRDSFPTGDHVLIVDDVIATGGTAAAACRLVERLGGRVAGVSCLIELAPLGGRDRLPAGIPLHAVMVYR